MKVTSEMLNRACASMDGLLPEVDQCWDFEEEREHDIRVIATQALEAALTDVPDDPTGVSTAALCIDLAKTTKKLEQLREIIGGCWCPSCTALRAVLEEP